MNGNQVILGTNGKLFINNVRMANVKNFELKANLQYEDILVNGELITQSKYKGATLTGTCSLHKTDSYMINLLKDSIKSGVMPSVKIVGELSDPNLTTGDEAIEIYDVMFDDATLMAFANGEVREESTAFRAGGYNYISTID